MARILIVSYSRSGNTAKLADAIAAACGADFDHIVELVDRRGGLGGYWRSAREAWGSKVVAIRPPAKNPDAYDLVILGTPVWVGSMSSPMRAYLTAHGRKLPRVAFFCTLGGSGAAKAFAQMSRLCGKTPDATLAVTERELRAGTCHEKVAAFVAGLGTLRSAA